MHRMEVYFIGVGLGSWGRVVRRFKGSLRGSLGVQGEIIMPYLTLDLWIAGGELLVNLHGPH